MDAHLPIFLFLDLPWVLLFVWTIYAFVVISMPRLARSWYNYHIFVSVPNVFVTLGILGTFSGIAYGLMGLDTTNLENSLPSMIAGMRTAFYTSIYGIILSLVTRKPIAWRVACGEVKEPPSDEQKLLSGISASLMAIQDGLAQQHQHQLVQADKNTAQWNELKATITQQSQRLVEGMDEMSERMARASSDAIMAALQEVIQDFNQAFKHYIGELVEKNFDKLTEAVDQMIEWQKAYRSDIESIRASYQEMLEKFEELVKHGETWVETMDSVAGSGSALQQVVDEFNLAFADHSRFRLTLDRIHSATEELNAGATNLKELGLKFDTAAQGYLKTQEHMDRWSASAEKVAGMVTDLDATLMQLRHFDIAQIPQLEESFMNRLQATIRSFDDLIKEYINYLENKK